MKFECIFAMSSPKTSTYRDTSRRAFLCSEIGVISSQIYGLLLPYGTPVRSLYGAVFGETGGNSLSCIYHSNTFPIMPKTGSICAGVKYSSTSAGRSGAKSVSYRKYEVEKNAKNQAYHFILSNGLLEEFAEFCRGHHARDAHKDCVDILLSII